MQLIISRDFSADQSGLTTGKYCHFLEKSGCRSTWTSGLWMFFLFYFKQIVDLTRLTYGALAHGMDIA
jgi:hypothetical protein